MPDPVALNLIGFAGKIGKSGKCPRFRFLPHHQRVTNYPAEISAALKTAGQEAAWPRKKNRSTPFGGQRLLALLMVSNGMDGMEAVLQALHRSVWGRR